jgi:uridine kinase
MNWRACAIDGPGGSGKSTIARQMAKDLGAEIVSMDSFLLQEEKYRISVIAKNYDLDRFSEEVTYPLLIGEPVRYRVADAQNQRMNWVEIPIEKPIIVDGIYSLEVRFREGYDFSLFVDADKETLLRRGVDNVSGAASWLDKWLEGEETYLEAQAPMTAATLILDGAAPMPSTQQIMELIQLRVDQLAR